MLCPLPDVVRLVGVTALVGRVLDEGVEAKGDGVVVVPCELVVGLIV